MNYHIIGGDGQEYGPVSDATIREWIADGRLDHDSKIRPEGAPEWATVGDSPEFGDALVPGEPAPRGAAGTVDIGACVSEGFSLFGKHWLNLVLACLIFIAISIAAGLVTSVLSTPFTVTLQAIAKGAEPDLAQIAWQVPLYLICLLINIAFTTLLYASGFRFLTRIARGYEPAIPDLFAAFRERTVPVMLTGLLSALVCLAGYLLCILPGIYLQVGYIYAPLIALEKNVGVWEAMEASRRMIHPQWWQMLVLVILMVVFCLAGVILCGVGILAAYPICGLMFAKAYCDLFNKARAGTAAR